MPIQEVSGHRSQYNFFTTTTRHWRLILDADVITVHRLGTMSPHRSAAE